MGKSSYRSIPRPILRVRGSVFGVQGLRLQAFRGLGVFRVWSLGVHVLYGGFRGCLGLRAGSGVGKLEARKPRSPADAELVWAKGLNLTPEDQRTCSHIPFDSLHTHIYIYIYVYIYIYRVLYHRAPYSDDEGPNVTSRVFPSSEDYHSKAPSQGHQPIYGQTLKPPNPNSTLLSRNS